MHKGLAREIQRRLGPGFARRAAENILCTAAAILAGLLMSAPELAFAQASYDTGTSLLHDFVYAIFVSWGPYIYMGVLGLLVLMVGKGWMPLKGALIAVVACFVFFCVPTIVRYMATKAAAQI
jgi:hypothetical protein